MVIVPESSVPPETATGTLEAGLSVAIFNPPVRLAKPLLSDRPPFPSPFPLVLLLDLPLKNDSPATLSVPPFMVSRLLPPTP